MATIDTKEIHKVVEDTDRFDTSQSGNSVTLEYQDSGEINVVAEFNNLSLQQTVPNTDRPYVLTFNPNNNNFTTKTDLRDLEDGELLVCLIK